MDLSHFDLQLFIITMAVLVVAITIHEFAHAITADRLGDPTPRSQGRISLFPTDHLDPIGTIMMVLTAIVGRGIGWGKPVLTNPRNFRHPRRDQAIVAVAGPISNILQAIVFSVLLRVTGIPNEATPVFFLLFTGMYINLALAFFNLIPIAPLDGHWIMTAILPPDLAERYYRWMCMYGPMLFIMVVFLAPGLLWRIYGPAVEASARLLLTGVFRALPS